MLSLCWRCFDGIVFAAINKAWKVFRELMRGLFVERIDEVATIYDLRFPRIIISIREPPLRFPVFCSTVLKNPLADPGIRFQR